MFAVRSKLFAFATALAAVFALAGGAEAGTRGLEDRALGLLAQAEAIEDGGLGETVQRGHREADGVRPVRRRDAVTLRPVSGSSGHGHTPNCN